MDCQLNPEKRQNFMTHRHKERKVTGDCMRGNFTDLYKKMGFKDKQYSKNLAQYVGI
jgi:hypothetical protein